jgi:hypothetical protein
LRGCEEWGHLQAGRAGTGHLAEKSAAKLK